MINELLNEFTIEVNYKAKSWEDAVRRSGELLKKAGKVEDVYIEAMIETVKELGPYIVICKNIAMPHARPERGSKGIGLALVTLETPINFGNKENDPVKTVIGFSAKDNNSHIKMLSELMQLFEDENFHKVINKATTEKEIKQFLLEKKFK